MKKYVFIVVLLISISCKYEVESRSTETTERYEKVDLNSKRVPDSLASSKEIAHFLTKNIPDTRKKVRAIHIWIANNIRYSVDNVDATTDIDKLIQETLEDRTGVCLHYAQLFHHMCQEIGVKSFYVSGYTLEKETYELADASHAWNGVQIDSSFYFIDNTWAAGYVKKNRFVKHFRDDFFLIEPREFIKTHMPFYDFFQFLNSPLSYSDFELRDFSNLRKKGNYNFADSIARFQDLDSLNKLYAENKLLKRDSTNNPLITAKLNYNNSVIDKYIFDADSEVYNKIGLKYYQINEKIKVAFALNNQFIEFMNSGVTETAAIKSEMQDVVRQAVKNYRQANALLLQLKKDKAELSEKSVFREGIDELINEMSNNLQTLREPLKVYALYADITIK